MQRELKHNDREILTGSDAKVKPCAGISSTEVNTTVGGDTELVWGPAALAAERQAAQHEQDGRESGGQEKYLQPPEISDAHLSLSVL